LQHPDLNPTNFFITIPSAITAPRVTVIIDWSDIGYYPKFYVTILPRGQYYFFVEDQPGSFDWIWMLSNAFIKVGFLLEMEYLTQTMPN